jgi:rhodanese-related sulfurtransferase
VLVGFAAIALSEAACVLWPAGTGPGAEPMPLAEAIDRRDRGEAVIVDVRSRQQYDAGHIAGAINVPLDEIAARVAEIRKLGKLPILYCG